MYCIAKGDNEMVAYLNENHPNPAYHCGRLLAVCQHIQSLAIGEPKAALLDRFYASASSSPGLVIPRIWKTALHHVKTVRSQNTALGDDLWALLRAIHAGIQDQMPTMLPLYEQGLFQLGFFHQQAFLPTATTTRQIRYCTKTHVPVRSKSEVILGNTLTDMGIEYSYEREIAIPDIPWSTLLPDFTIDRDADRPPIIVEHLGLLDRPAYRARWDQKLVAYRQLGIELAENGGGPNGVLVTTLEADIEDVTAFAERIKGILAAGK
jgi:CRISPR-associated protein Csd1